MSDEQEKRGIDDLNLDNKKELKREIQELIEETWLSPREAEICVIMNRTNKYDFLSHLADDLEICHDTIYTLSHNINQKLGKSKRTLDSVEKI